MKKIFTTVLSMLMITVVFGQWNQAQQKKSFAVKPVSSDLQQAFTKKQDVKAPLDTIWYDNFSDSLATMTNYSFHDSTGNNFNWAWANTGPDGAYTAPSEIIHSTTYTNGYMLLNADGFNTVGGPTGTAMVTTPVDMNASFTTPAINCSGKNSVVVRLQEKFRFCCDNGTRIQLLVSNNGTTWTAFDLRKDVKSNTASTPDPTVVEYNITAIAANQPTVYLKVEFALSSHYFMCVDDILLYEAAANDFRIDKAMPKVFWTNDFPRLSKVPLITLNCPDANGLLFTTKLHNMGATDDSPSLHVRARNVTQANAIDYDETAATLTSGLTSIAPGGIDTLIADNSFYPERKGNYRLIYEVAGTGVDNTPLNNIDSTNTIEVTDSVLTMWKTLSTSQGISISGYRTSDAAFDGDAAAQYLYLPCADTISSISFYPLRKTGYLSEYPISAVAAIYQYITGSGWSLLDETMPFDLTAVTQFNKWQTIKFANFLELEAGEYLFAIQSFGGKLFFGTDYNVYQPTGTNFIYLADEQNWYYISEGTFGLQLNFFRTPNTGVDENKANTLNANCFPNPAQSNVNFNLQLTESENVEIQMHDIAGKLVFSQKYENLNSGENNISIDTRNLENGLYLYTINSETGSITGKLNIIR